MFVVDGISPSEATALRKAREIEVRQPPGVSCLDLVPRTDGLHWSPRNDRGERVGPLDGRPPAWPVGWPEEVSDPPRIEAVVCGACARGALPGCPRCGGRGWHWSDGARPRACPGGEDGARTWLPCGRTGLACPGCGRTPTETRA